MVARASLTDTAFGLGWAAVRRLPEPVAYGLLQHIATVCGGASAVASGSFATTCVGWSATLWTYRL